MRYFEGSRQIGLYPDIVAILVILAFILICNFFYLLLLPGFVSLFTCRSISIFPLTSLIIFSEKGTKGEKVNLEVGMKAEID